MKPFTKDESLKIYYEINKEDKTLVIMAIGEIRGKQYITSKSIPLEDITVYTDKR